RGMLGYISPLGDMVCVMAGVTLSFKLRREDRVGLVYAGDGATSSGAFHEGINLAAVQRCPLVVVVESNHYAYSTPTAKQTAAKQMVDKAIGYGIAGEQADGNDILAVYDATKRAVDRARQGGGVSLVELLTYRRKGHAEHDSQSYVPSGEIEWWEVNNDPVDRYVKVLRETVAVQDQELVAIDERVRLEVDSATELAELSPAPEPSDALEGMYADPARETALWFREGKAPAVMHNERPDGWGTAPPVAANES
ncbi:MAG: thiamine pyrophosphate-dependent dehydrogenase E1 component subunit alpha, partial [Gemmatimonadaceae bacterium]